jgi:hypothetical protein
MNWDKVARYLEQAANTAQDEANRRGASGMTRGARERDETAKIFRELSKAIRFGLGGQSS